MKIIQITPSYKPAYVYGGPTMSVAKLCETLALQHTHAGTEDCKFELEVLTTTANGKEELRVKSGEQVMVDGVPVTYFKRITKDHTHFSPDLLLNLRKKIIAHKIARQPVVIHIHSWWNLVTIFSCLIAKIYRIPVLLTPRGMLTQYTATTKNSRAKSLIHKLLGKNLLNYCHIHATSEKEEKDILEIVKPKSLSIIYNLVSLAKNRIHSPPECGSAHLKLIFLSRIEAKKGLELLFEALSELPTKWELTIAGNGEKEYIEALKHKTRSLGVADKVNWVGQINNNDKFQLLADHDLMVLTSYNENFANVVVESLSMGTAVMVSEEVGLADYVKQHALGWVCSLTSESIRETLLFAAKSGARRLEIRNKAANFIERDFNPTTLTDKFMSLYQKISVRG
ncbi:MAG: glycosyltransferase [Pedobacter sp.]|nr:MAG: glycosyltransferase [Pedobacter sp.]